MTGVFSVFSSTSLFPPLRAGPVGFVLRPVLSEVEGLTPKGQCPTQGKGRGDLGGTPPKPPDLLRRSAVRLGMNEPRGK